MTTAKENANPQLFFVENADRYSHTRRAPLDWTNLGTFEQEQRESGSDRGRSKTSSGSAAIVVPTTAEDKAILRAIMDSSRSTTNGKGVGLLRKAGLVIPTYSSYSKRSATTTPSSSWFSDSSRPIFQSAEDEVRQGKKDNEDDNHNDSEKKSDESDISPEEIFDIIRTIQDPEHPNSLEQLGVVSLEQVELSLARDREEKNNRNQDEINIRFTPTIPVSKQFTNKQVAMINSHREHSSIRMIHSCFPGLMDYVLCTHELIDTLTLFV